MKISTTLILSIAIVSNLPSSYATEDQTDTAALVADYVSASAGLESVVPVFKQVDHNADGKLDGWNFHFEIYKFGTLTKLFSTPNVYFGAPACSMNPVYLFSEVSQQPVFRKIGSRVILSNNIHLNGDCFNSYLYGVDISAAGKTPWSKAFAGGIYGTAILADLNANGISELSVTVLKDAATSTDATYYVYDGSTGAIISKAQTYAVAR